MIPWWFALIAFIGGLMMKVSVSDEEVKRKEREVYEKAMKLGLGWDDGGAWVKIAKPKVRQTRGSKKD